LQITDQTDLRRTIDDNRVRRSEHDEEIIKLKDYGYSQPCMNIKFLENNLISESDLILDIVFKIVIMKFNPLNQITICYSSMHHQFKSVLVNQYF